MKQDFPLIEFFQTAIDESQDIRNERTTLSARMRDLRDAAYHRHGIPATVFNALISSNRNRTRLSKADRYLLDRVTAQFEGAGIGKVGRYE